jgi:hypothetical protein
VLPDNSFIQEVGHLRSADLVVTPDKDQTVSGGHLRSAIVSATFTPAGVTPGTSCVTAGAMPLSTPYTGTIAGGFPPGQDWFKVSVTPGNYKGLLIINSGFGPGVSLWSGSCGSLTPVIPTFGTICNTVTIAFTGLLYIQISGSVFGSCNYTLEVRSGSCPW